MSNRTLTLAALFLLVMIPGLARDSAAADTLTVSSPDGALTVSVAVKALPQPYLAGKRVYYRVSYKGKVILTDSPLGLDFWEGNALEEGLKVVGTKKETHNTSWENPLGTKRIVPDHYNQLTVSLEEKQAPDRRVDVILRAYNEGIALRYHLPEQAAIKEFALAEENTGFYFAGDVDGYVLNMGRENTHNEAEYLRMPLKQIKPSSVINVPLVVEVPGGPWAALMEADLTDYAGMYVKGVAGVRNGLMTHLSKPPRKEEVANKIPWPEYQRMEQPVKGRTPKSTPWRVLMVGETPGRLIETSYLILNLNPPCALADTSWIKPGRAAWDWWSGSYAENVPFETGMNTATMKHYIEFAGRHHLEYMLIDAGWNDGGDAGVGGDILKPSPQFNIQEIMDLANKKGVKVLLWVHWRAMVRQCDAALAQYEKWGVAGIKIDIMNRDDQEMVNYYDEWVRKAAQHHLVVDLHGAYKPTGKRRTYPNIMGVEAVMGMEYSKWSDRITPEYDVTIPFTRMLAGPMDYTPGGFRNSIRGRFKILDIAPMTQGTRAHQLAQYVVYEVPLVMLADYPEAYEGQAGLEFIEKVPTVWDETKVLNGEVGKYITIARQKNNAWYIGSMTNWDARDLEIPLTFLGPGEYEAQIFADGADADKVATSLAISTQRVKATDKLQIHLAPGGGLAVILKPVGR